MNTLMYWLNAGGPVVAILFAFSLVAVTLIAGKLIQLYGSLKLHSSAAAQALEYLRKGQISQALLLTKGSPTPRAAIIGQVINLHASELSPQQQKEEALRLARSHAQTLTNHLMPLDIIANLSPLLGLFGTVLGMITAFQAMESAGTQVNPSILSGGIWQALLTTAVGLAVAIPVTMCHSWLSRRAELEASAIQDHMDATFTELERHTSHNMSSKIA